jgi:hypothetical protein
MRFGGSVWGAEGRSDGAPPPSIPLAKPFAGLGAGFGALHNGALLLLQTATLWAPLGTPSAM